MENSGLTLYDGNGMFLNEIDTCVVLLLFFSLRKLLESIPMFLKCTEVELNLHFFFLSPFCFLVSNDGNTTDNTNSHISYDVSKLVDFPGFNVASPHTMKDVRPMIL